jgi:hypothetical protein
VKTFPKWVHSVPFGFWHEFDHETMRSLCGRHETDSTETKTPGGAHCRACLDAAAVPAEDWRRRSEADEPEPEPEPEASTLVTTPSGLEVVVDVSGVCRRAYGLPMSALSPVEVGIAVLDAAGQPLELAEAQRIGDTFFAGVCCIEPHG